MGCSSTLGPVDPGHPTPEGRGEDGGFVRQSDGVHGGTPFPRSVHVSAGGAHVPPQTRVVPVDRPVGD